ncbi:MAG TPA: ABC transporter ATP-binding protein [Planctomycetaceae bacterium]|jgi:ABC-2 type transport system ATP-binding protein|nr:ABC transporter ATP-binding protein [Planctomycetaceae bacterium]
MNEPALSIRNLRKSFGSKTVLEDVTLEITRGQTIALLGRNGAGKTALIRILLGLVAADGGAARVLGRDPATEPIELRRRVGYLAEDQVMYGWMTAIELCRFLEPFYPTWDMRIAQDYLDRFEVPWHQRIRELSKGQTVKLGLAVALAHRPELAILDDPAIGLDPIARKEFARELIEHLQAEGRTVLYSSHLLAEVEAVADSVAILHNGRIARHAPTETLRDEIKQIVLPLDAADSVSPPSGLLDVRRHDDRFVVTVDGASAFLETLAASGIDHEVIDLSLDDIFEAIVIGRPQGWPRPLSAVAM